MAQCKSRYPELWVRGKKLFMKFDAARDASQRDAVERMLDALSWETQPDEEFTFAVAIGEALAPPGEAGRGLDLTSLGEAELKLYYIVLDGFTPDQIAEMTMRALDAVWPYVQRGHALPHYIEEVVVNFGFTEAYMRRRTGVTGF